MKTNKLYSILSIFACIFPLLSPRAFALGVVAAEGGGGSAPTPAPAPAPTAAAPAPAPTPAPAPAAATPGVSARLKAALAGLGGGTPATITAELQQTKAKLTQAEADLSTVKASLKTSETALASVCGLFGIKAEDLAGKSDAEIDALFGAAVSAAAVDKLAGLGVAPGKLPAPKANGSGDSKTKTKAEFDALTPREKMEFSVNGGRLVD